jgi:1-aminocyclopropane-1-carboxylate deaminase/D-cysteine desulfhydrase-like pyridoxal-dependent ACC family enzyme
MTPINLSKYISDKLKINLMIKNDNLYPAVGGGNKARKLKYIINDDIQKNYNAVVTTGSAQSNHIRATSLYAAQLGWKMILVIHDNKPEILEGNLKLASLTGAELRYIKKDEVKNAMLLAMNSLIEKGYIPLNIYGGGHCVQGSYAYYEAVKELKKQLGAFKPDFIIVASGTGTTQAGLEIGIRQFYPECKVLGVSISRLEKKGKKAIIDSMNELNIFLNNQIILTDNIFFDDSWIGDGYEETYPALFKTIHWAAETEGLILDPTYTGKAFHALIKYVEIGLIPVNSNVIFWHTGGLLNLISSKEI